VLARLVRLLVDLVAVDEGTGPVLSAGEVGVPRRDAVGTVVDGAPGPRAVRAVLGLDDIRAADWTADLHRRGGGDAAIARDEAMLREVADRLAAAQGSGWAKSWAKWPVATVGKGAENLVGREGIEPPTPGFSVLCSTD
jgi:hypothetical protein